MAAFEVDSHGTILEEADGVVTIRPRRILIKATVTTTTHAMKSAAMGILEVEVVINNNHSHMDIIQAQEDRGTTTNNSRYLPIMEHIPKGEKEMIVKINEEMEDQAEELVNKATTRRGTTPATADLIEDSENLYIKIKTSSTSPTKFAFLIHTPTVYEFNIGKLFSQLQNIGNTCYTNVNVQPKISSGSQRSAL